MIQSIQLDDITIDITRKKIKNLHLKIASADGRVSISAPMRMSMTIIQDFVLSKLPWIKKHQHKLQGRGQVKPHEYQAGESHYFLGKPYTLNIIEHHKRPSVILEHDQICLCVKQDTSKEKKEALLAGWYRAQLQQMLPALIAKWELAMGVTVKQFFIRNMKTRWGSCSHRSGRIRFNLSLAKKSFECLEYVVVHELVHLLEPSHNHRFVALMDQFMPQWRVYKKTLNQY